MSIRPGGGLTVLLGLLQGLASHDGFEFDATVVCSADGTREEIEKQGIATVKQPLRNSGGLKRQLWVTASMASYVKKLKPDAFLSINQFVPRIPCPQIVYHINLLRFLPIDKSVSLKTRIFERLRNYSSKQALKHAAANVYESAYIQQCATNIYQNSNPNDRVIYIGLPDNLANANRSEQPSQWTPGQIFSITNGNPHKDNATLITIVSELVKRRPEVDWKLKIAGGLFPELWKPYKQLASELGVIERIEWIGFQNQYELTKHLNESLCSVSTSRIESFCMVALESMGRGCPTIVANCASMPESVGTAGMLAAPGDAAEFAKAVVRLHDDSELRNQFVIRGFEHIRNFRWERCGQEFAELLTKLSSESQRRLTV